MPIEKQYFDEQQDPNYNYENHPNRQDGQFFGDNEYGFMDEDMEPQRKEFYPKSGFVWSDPDDDRHYGGCWAFAYWNGSPLCIIGPDCKKYIDRVDLTFLGPFSVIMLLVIVFFWQAGQETLYLPNYPHASRIAAYIVKACHWSVTLVMVLKNPGIVSCDRMTVLPDIENETKFRRTRPCEPC